MPSDDTPSRHARRWADAAWNAGWHDHAIDVLDHAIRLDPDDYKLYRKRGACYLLCADSTVRDEEQGFADLRRACELSGWQSELVRWVAEVLTHNGYAAWAEAILRGLAEHGGSMDEDEPA